MSRHYRYVGSSEILDNIPKSSARKCIHSSQDLIQWVEDTKQTQEYDGAIIVTFIIDTNGELWINDRHSEHVLCANGQNVLSAGEMTFSMDDNVEVIEVTNQSTGYCPEPDSWYAVEGALDKAKIPHPSNFTAAYLFRRCENCGQKNIVKDEWFYCGVCDNSLDKEWNFDKKK